MAPCYRLGGLQVGKARHDPIGARLGLTQQRLDQDINRLDRGIALITDPHTEIQRDLIIPATGGVQTTRRIADHVAKPCFDVHVNIFERGRKLKFALLDF